MGKFVLGSHSTPVPFVVLALSSCQPNTFVPQGLQEHSQIVSHRKGEPTIFSLQTSQFYYRAENSDFIFSRAHPKAGFFRAHIYVRMMVREQMRFAHVCEFMGVIVHPRLYPRLRGPPPRRLVAGLPDRPGRF